jgi:DNA modification methylase
MQDFNRLQCVDCVVGVRSLERGSVHLTVTSPPYDSLRDYKGFAFDHFTQLAHELYRVMGQAWCNLAVCRW